MQIIGTGFIQSLHSFCRFGPNGTPTPVLFIDPVMLNCTSSPGSGNLSVFLTFDGSTWIDTGFIFFYRREIISVSKLDWALIEGSISLVVIGAIVICFVKRNQIQKFFSKSKELQPLLDEGEVRSLIKASDLKIKKELGRGAFGVVNSALY